MDRLGKDALALLDNQAFHLLVAVVVAVAGFVVKLNPFGYYRDQIKDLRDQLATEARQREERRAEWERQQAEERRVREAERATEAARQQAQDKALFDLQNRLAGILVRLESCEDDRAKLFAITTDQNERMLQQAEQLTAAEDEIQKLFRLRLREGRDED